METKIQTIEILKDYHKITGARVSLHDLDFNEIAGYPESPSYFCEKSSKIKPQNNFVLNVTKKHLIMRNIRAKYTPTNAIAVCWKR